MIPSAVLFYP
jgi:hypothetical protein